MSNVHEASRSAPDESVPTGSTCARRCMLLLSHRGQAGTNAYTHFSLIFRARRVLLESGGYPGRLTQRAGGPV